MGHIFKIAETVTVSYWAKEGIDWGLVYFLSDTT